MLIIQGERDTFGTPDELRPHLETMNARVTLQVVPGADHSLVVRSRKKDEIMREVLDTAAAWMRAHVGT
jgi:predicted alpha/beta-hydrolase family hydrolase